MEPIIRNHFAVVGGRRMHYRHASDGPVVVLLHASPNSAKVVEEVQKVFATEFSTIAVDLPGYGLSDALDLEDLRTEDLADAIVGLLDELGIGQAALYGRHTGAGIAVEIAHRHPSRVSMVLTDGFPVFSTRYSDERLDDYLGRIEPRWDGSHLTWVWFRSRDLFVFWPWDKREAAARADTDVPSPDAVHRAALELLEAGNGFRKVYASAFRHAGLAMIDKVVPPVCFGNRPGDSQFRTMPQYPASAWTMEMPRETRAAAVQERAVLRQYPASGTFQPADDISAEHWPAIGYLDHGERQMLVRASGKGRAGTTVLLLHDLPGSSALHQPLFEALSRAGPTLAVDLMGQGESWEATDLGPAAWARQLCRLVDALGLERVSLVAIGASAPAAIELALARPDVVDLMVLQSPPVLSDGAQPEFAKRYPVSIDPEWDGTHLIRLFHHLRDQELWWPWYDRRAATIRRSEPRLDASELTLRVRECAKQPKNYRRVWSEVLSYPLAERMAVVATGIVVASAPSDLFAPLADAAAALTSTSPLIALFDNRTEQATQLADLARGAAQSRGLRP